MTEMTYLEYDEMVSKNSYESYTQEQVQEFSRDILKSMDSHERTIGAIDFASLVAVEVRNKDLSKSVMYFREQQIEWDKTEGDDFMKARAGVYKDTPINRKKGLVGARYGAEKKVDTGLVDKSKLKVGNIVQRNDSPTSSLMKVTKIENGKLFLEHEDGRTEKTNIEGGAFLYNANGRKFSESEEKASSPKKETKSEKATKESQRKTEQEKGEKEEADRYSKMSDAEKKADHDRKEKEGETRNDKLNRKYAD